MPSVDPHAPDAEPAANESYPTFWDAVPLDGHDTPAPAATNTATPPDDTYAAFYNVSEDGRAARLSVEQTDVG